LTQRFFLRPLPLPLLSRTQPSVVLAEVAVIAMAAIWGVNYSVIKYGVGLMTPVAYNAVRVALAALVVGASPALIALFGRFMGVERITSRGALGIALSIFGVGLVVLGSATGHGAGSGGSLFGDFLVICGSICWAIYTILLVPYSQRLSGFWIIAMSLLGGSIVLLTVGARAIVAQDWSAFPVPGWIALVYSGLGGLVIAYLFWYRGVKVLGPTRTALFANLQPFIALLVAWITLHETPTAWQAVGAGTIVGGVLLTRVPAPDAP